jgi:hypothetical protein
MSLTRGWDLQDGGSAGLQLRLRRLARPSFSRTQREGAGQEKKAHHEKGCHDLPHEGGRGMPARGCALADLHSLFGLA